LWGAQENNSTKARDCNLALTGPKAVGYVFALFDQNPKGFPSSTFNTFVDSGESSAAKNNVSWFPADMIFSFSKLTLQVFYKLHHQDPMEALSDVDSLEEEMVFSSMKSLELGTAL